MHTMVQLSRGILTAEIKCNFRWNYHFSYFINKVLVTDVFKSEDTLNEISNNQIVMNWNAVGYRLKREGKHTIGRRYVRIKGREWERTQRICDFGSRPKVTRIRVIGAKYLPNREEEWTKCANGSTIVTKQNTLKKKKIENELPPVRWATEKWWI